MLELKRSLNDLKGKYYEFQDVSELADNTFKISDFPDRLLRGKNTFRLHLNEEVLVRQSQVYIDILDKFGNSIYYRIISDNLPNKERIVVVYIYDTTPIGDCEILIAGRLKKHPLLEIDLPFSNDPSSTNHHDIPNVVWRKVIQINKEEVENTIYYSVPPTITYSEIRKPQYQLSTDNRLINTLPTSSGRVTMYSNRGQLTTMDTIGKSGGHILSQNTSSATFEPITGINNADEIAALYFTGFTLSSSMEGGRISINNIPYSYPRNAAVTSSKVLNYSGSIVKVVNVNLCYVNPPLHQILDYTDTDGNLQRLVIDGFRETTNFTSSHRTEPSITVDSSSYSSYIKLELSNTEPEIGSVKSVAVKGKYINKPGKVVDLGTYEVGRKNILIVNTGSYTMTSRGIEPLSLGNFRKLGTVSDYWSGSNNVGFVTDFSSDTNIVDGIKFPSVDYAMQSENQYAEFHLKPGYLPAVKASTEYEITFDLYFQDSSSLVVPRQVDVYISGSDVDNTTGIQTAVMSPLKSSRFGTYIGSIDTSKSTRHKPKFYFTAKKTGNVTPVFVNRSMSNLYGNVEMTVRDEPGYSSKTIDLEIPLPQEFESRGELEIEVEYLNSKNEGANYKTSLYGVVFQGNTPSSTPLPSGTVSGSDQLTASYDGRYERKGTGIVSSSTQITEFGFLNTGSIYPYTASINARLNSIESTTGSLNTFTGSANTRLNSLETKTGSYATTGSNQFNGNQSISGSLTVSDSLIVNRATGSFSGSFHGQYSSSQQVDYNQISNKIVISNPSQYRVFTSDGSTSGSIANKEVTYISSSAVKRTRLSDMVELERAVSSSFWSSEVMYVTQSIFSFNAGTNNMFMYYPIFKDSDAFLTVSASTHNASYAVRIETQVYGLTGSLAAPRDNYMWATTTEFKAFIAPYLTATPTISNVFNVPDSTNAYGAFGQTFAGRVDLSGWFSFLAVIFTAPDGITVRHQMTSTGSGVSPWTFYVASSCRVIKNEIRY